MNYIHKNTTRIKNSLVIISLFCYCLVANGQYSEFGIGGGAMTYWGDLNSSNLPTNLSKNSGFAIQLSYRKYFKNYFAFRASIATGKVQGADRHSTIEWQKLRNLDFFSSVQDLSVMGEFYLFGFNTEPGSSIFSPYFAVGLTAFRFNPKTYYQGNEIRLQPIGTEGQGLPGFDKKYSLSSIGIPIGGGAKLILSEKINIGAEVIMRWTATDYLDDLGGYYVNHDDLRAGNGALAASLGNRMQEYLGQDEPVLLATGIQRGGPEVNDFYFVSTLSINVMLESQGRSGRGKNRIICPKF
jgi:hypothetical protein